MDKSQFGAQTPNLESDTGRGRNPDSEICPERKDADEYGAAENDKMYGPFDTVADLMKALNA